MTQDHFKYNPRLKELAKELRNNSTFSERLLWSQLKRKQLLGFDFHRQKPIDEFVVDFFCPDLCLAIEIDGQTHAYKGSDDIKRQEKLEGLGLSLLRFPDNDVKNNLEGVVSGIRNWIEEHHSS